MVGKLFIFLVCPYSANLGQCTGGLRNCFWITIMSVGIPTAFERPSQPPKWPNKQRGVAEATLPTFQPGRGTVLRCPFHSVFGFGASTEAPLSSQSFCMLLYFRYLHLLRIGLSIRRLRVRVPSASFLVIPARQTPIGVFYYALRRTGGMGLSKEDSSLAIESACSSESTNLGPKVPLDLSRNYCKITIAIKSC